MNKNQLIVLEYLKEKRIDNLIFDVLPSIWETKTNSEVRVAYCELTEKEEWEVIAKLAEWGLSQC